MLRVVRLCHAHRRTLWNQWFWFSSHRELVTMTAVAFIHQHCWWAPSDTAMLVSVCWPATPVSSYPPLKCADTGLLSNTSGGYGQTVRHSFSCRHTWKAQELWRKRIMFSPVFSVINNIDEHCFEDVRPRNPHGLQPARHKHQNTHANTPYLIFGDCVWLLMKSAFPTRQRALEDES